MCTVTLIPLETDAGAFRLVSNRDELRTRPRAEVAREHDDAEGRSIWPVDPVGGGTWIGVNENGLAMTLLNLNITGAPALPHASRLDSRGSIIPHLLEAQDLPRALARLERLDLDRYARFRLVLADATAVHCARWDRAELAHESWPIEPICFASSGLGDEVAQPRLPLWASMVRTHGATSATQDAFHEHAWPDRAAASVMMSRDAARTTSTTVVEVTGERVSMRHRDDDGWHGTVHLSARTGAPSAR